MKQRFSSLDVKVIAHELNSKLVGLRVNNIYDLSSRIFLFKFRKPDNREQLLIDSGFRCHLTSFVRTTAAAPSPFVAKLRKALRTRRVTGVFQIGTDRIIEIQFSDGQYRLFLEFYAAGNIILTDGELSIWSLLRNVTEGAEHEQLRVGLKYDLSRRQNYNGIPPLSKERITTGLKAAIEKKQKTEGKGGKKQKQKEGDALRKALAVSINEFPPPLVDHAFTVTGFDATVAPEKVLESEALLDKLLSVLQEAQRVVTEITGSEIVKGFIIAKKGKSRAQSQSTSSDAQEANFVYDDFHPFRPNQFESNPNVKLLEFEGFNKTVDEFYSSIEGQKLESRLAEREEAARKKLEQARKDHDKRIGGLQHVQELNIRKAEAIQANVERVEEATAAVNGLIAQGMDWVDIGRLIEAEQKCGNAVAQLIKLPLKLYENTVTLLLGEAEAEEYDSGCAGSETESETSDSEEEEDTKANDSKNESANDAQDSRLAIDIDLSLSSWANASQYYDQKKTAAVKEEKTLQASAKALKSAEQKIARDLKKDLTQEKDVLRPVRKQFWFEKFHYFISSDGYLVLAGKDAQQNELLYKRYLKKGDVYVHADLNGAPSVIIKNNPQTPEAPIPPSTLSQAGNFSVSASSAWDLKAVMSAWWVSSDQVSKTAPTGEYLTTGAFMIRGKKNFLPPSQLLLGVAIIFQISEESKARHLRHRVDTMKSVDGEDSKVEGSTQVKEEEKEMQGADVPEEPEPEEPEPLEKPTDGGADAVVPDVEEGLDEESPNVKMEAEEEDSDEDFPDAQLDTFNEDYEEDTRSHSQNPLQSGFTSLKLDDQEDSANGEPNETKKPPPRHLSAYERRLLKKGIDPSTVPRDSQDATPDESGADEPSIPPSTTTATKDKQKPLPRGKKGKAKKAAKYADQDEEDRELAMRILGSKSGQDAAEAAAKARREKEEKEAADKQRRREQHLRNQAAGKAAEEARRAALERDDADEEDGEDEAARLEILGLDTLVGRPLPGDEILCAIPVCAPWAALARCKYRAKMQPGNVKKGKAVKEILGKWQSDAKDPRKVDGKEEDGEKIWPREAELILGLKETEVIGVVPVGKVRIMMGGDSGAGGKDGQKGKGKASRGGRGSKKAR